jgi:aspartate carbamoyltransferase catalytic subunit
VNAGDGTGEHPTQALLDVFTICDELHDHLVANKKEKLTIVLLGDLKHGRTVHSLAKLLARSGMAVKLRYCSPESLAMPEYVKDYVAGCNVEQEEINDLNDAIHGANVLYVTRVQKERFESQGAYDSVKVCSCLETTGRLLPEHRICTNVYRNITHPLYSLIRDPISSTPN